MPQQNSTIGGSKLEPLSLQRARRVYEKRACLPKDTEGVNFLKGLPSMIVQNGLGPTSLFLMIKRNELYRCLAELLGYNEANFLDTIMKAESEEYIRLQREALEYAGWMKELALAQLSTKQTGGAA